MQPAFTRRNAGQYRAGVLPSTDCRTEARPWWGGVEALQYLSRGPPADGLQPAPVRAGRPAAPVSWLRSALVRGQPRAAPGQHAPTVRPCPRGVPRAPGRLPAGPPVRGLQWGRRARPRPGSPPCCRRPADG